jgi:hypothetical protein
LHPECYGNTQDGDEDNQWNEAAWEVISLVGGGKDTQQ